MKGGIQASMHHQIIREEALSLLNPLRRKEFHKWKPSTIREKELKQRILIEYQKLCEQDSFVSQRSPQ